MASRRLFGSRAGTTALGQIAMNQWQAEHHHVDLLDANGNGVRDAGENRSYAGADNFRSATAAISNFNNTDLSGNAGSNEIPPLHWYVIETDTTRYKNTRDPRGLRRGRPLTAPRAGNFQHCQHDGEYSRNDTCTPGSASTRRAVLRIRLIARLVMCLAGQQAESIPLGSPVRVGRGFWPEQFH